MKTENAVTLPRGDDPMRGLWPGAIYMQTLLQQPVTSDEMAEELVALVGYLEDRQAKLDSWYRAGLARIERAKQALASAAAYTSLPDYVRAHPTKKGGKQLDTAAGTIKLRIQKKILRVYDEKLAKQYCPSALYTYQAPATEKLNKDKLKENVEMNGPLLFSGADGAAVIIAEVIPEIETMQITPKPSVELEGAAQPPRLLADVIRKEESSENPDASQSE